MKETNSIFNLKTTFSIFCFLLLGILFSCDKESNGKETAKQPNIILIMADDLGWGDVGFNGNDIIKTPNLDALAAKGAILSHFYSASSVCSPTRASALTGRNPYRQGIYTANKGYLRSEEITLAELLKQKGYATGMFGKWHLGTLTTKVKDANRGMPGDSSHYSIPTQHGFDEYFVTESKVPTYDPMIQPLEFDTENGESWRYGWSEIKNNDQKQFGTAYWKGVDNKVADSLLKGDDTGIIIDQAMPFIEKSIKAGQPYLSVIWTHTPHLPIVTQDKYKQQYSQYTNEEQLYFGAVTALDDQIGRLMAFLEEKGGLDNTLLFFASDNGPEVRTPGVAGPYRGKKRDLYDGGIRVPAFTVYPAGIESGQIIRTPMVTSDYLPTIMALVDPEFESETVLDGENMVDALRGKANRRKSGLGFQYPGSVAWLQGNYKLIRPKKDAEYELYNLNDDHRETTDIIQDHPDLALKMKNELELWIASCKNSDNGNDYTLK